MNIDPATVQARPLNDVLRDARELLSVEDRWVQNALAVSVARYYDPRNYTPSLTRVKPTDPEAARWCLLGAVAKYSNAIGLVPPSTLQYLDHLATRHGRVSIEELNDNVDHAGLLAFLDRAILETT
jgi:hypothetical protein